MADIIVFFIFLFTILYYAYTKSSQIQTETNYLLANRNTGFFALTATLVMTEFNPSTLVAFSQAGYHTGIWGLSLPFVFLVGLLFYTFTVAKHWKRLNVSSVAELFTIRYNPMLGKIASIFLLVAMFGFSANYIKSLQILFQPIFIDIPPIALSLLIVLVIIGMTIRGGLVSVIQTDVFSFFFTIVFIPMLFYFAYTFTSSSASFEKISIEDGQTALPPRFVFSLILLTMFTYIAAPWYGQKIFSARSERVAFTSVGVSAILVFLLYGFPVMAVYALNLHSVSLGNTETGLAYILGNLFTPGFRGFGYFVLFCAGATTLGGVWSAMTTMIITDLSSQKMDDSKGTSRSVKLSLLIAFISYFLSILFIDKVLDKLILANIPIAALSFGLLGGFYWKKTSSIGVSVSLVVGMIWGIFCYIYFGEAGMYTWYWSVYGIPAIFGSGILFSLLFPDTKISFHTV